MWSWRCNSGTRRATRSDLGIPQTKTAHVNDRTGIQSQLGPGRASRETDLAVALVGFAFCRARQAALRSTRAILRSQVACGAINGVIAAIGTIFVTSTPCHVLVLRSLENEAIGKTKFEAQRHTFGWLFDCCWEEPTSTGEAPSFTSSLFNALLLGGNIIDQRGIIFKHMQWILNARALRQLNRPSYFESIMVAAAGSARKGGAF